MSLLASLFVWLSCTFCVMVAQETPTLTNSSGEYYIFTASAAARTIVCTNILRCTVKCSGEQSCASTTISASGTANLVIQCLNRHACRTLTISDGPSDSADIECVSQFGYACAGYSSSYYSTFELRNTNNINIVCDQSTTGDSSDGGSCYGLTLNAHNADEVTVVCASKEDCYKSTINVVSVTSSATITGTGEKALYESTVNAASANQLSVQCNGRSACQYANMYPPYDQQWAFSLTCANLFYSCSALDVYIPSYQTFTDSWADVGCPISSAITGTCDISWYCNDLPSAAKPTDMVFSSSNGRWQCESNTNCCPWSNHNTMSKLPTPAPTTAFPSDSPTTGAPTQTSTDPTQNPSKSPIYPTKGPTRKPTLPPTDAPSAVPTSSPSDHYVAGDGFPGYTLFVRGYNVWKMATAGNALLDINFYDANIESWTDEGSSCSLSSLEFDSSFSSYSEYAESSSTSIEAGYSAGAGGAGGSMSKERTETKSYAAAAQSYIYSLDLECSLSEASLSTLNTLHWSSNFIDNFRILPDTFDSSDINTWTDFWDSFGTHLIKTAKLGGRVTGAITVDKCSVEESYSDSESYQLCLNAAYSGVAASGCTEESSGSSSGHNAQNAITNQRIVVKGGSTAVFTDVFNSFTDKSNNFQSWIDGLDTEPDVIGGNLDEIHDAMRTAINLGTHNFNDVSSVDLTNEEWIAKADVLEQAYIYYSGVLADKDTDLESSCELTHCGEGTLDKVKCKCNDCSQGNNCCGTDSGGCNAAQVSLCVMFVLFYFAM